VEAPQRLHQSSPAELKERLEAERRGIPVLVLRDGGGRQLIHELSADSSPLTVGRQSTSDVALTWDDEVSRAHAAIECIGNVWTVVDDGRSRNGSFVNGERVHGRRPLRHGDVVAFGRTTLEFVAPLSRGDDSTVVGSTRAAPPITPAQQRVLVALCRPLAAARFATTPSNRELAGELSLSVETVKFHLHGLFALFGLEDVPQHHKRAALAQMALEQGVVGPRELLGDRQG
jgi:pSer/pThr/pTyr-binding forkhead associated (FHA) protein